MTNIRDYIKTRNVAIILTIILLVLGSIAYFGTSVANRNNEMMYKEIYGENATDTSANDTILNLNINSTSATNAAKDVNIKSELV
jgi:hypothetical protein